MVGVETLLEALRKNANTEQLTLTTEQLNGNETHDFLISQSDDKVSSVSFRPSDASIPQEASIIMVRPVVESGSTDSDFQIFEDTSRDSVDEVLRISDLSVNDSVQTFQPASGKGAPFENQEGDNEIPVRITENSNNQSQYTFRIRWVNLGDV